MTNASTLSLKDIKELLPLVVIGAEDDDHGDEGDGNGDEDAGGDNDAKNNPSEEHDDADDPKVRGLKNALVTERARADKLAKELKRRDKAKADAALAEQSELEQANTKLQAAQDRVSKLAAGYLQSQLNSAIRSAAEKAKFIDSEDAIAGVDRSKLVFEQDEDDPSVVTIDIKSIQDAVKALATKKPHFIQSGTDDGEPTGGKFGGNSKRKATTEDELRKKYSALNQG